MIEIDLIRHVKVSGKAALYGCTDIEPMATENVRLLERLVTQQQSSRPYQGIICSPLIRCQHLAKEFSKRCKLPLELSADLQEMNFGVFDGVPFDDLTLDHKANNVTAVSNIKGQETSLHWSQLEAFFQAPAEIALPEAETLTDFHHRVMQVWQNLIIDQLSTASEAKEKSAPRRILVVAHGGVIRMILAHVLQLDWQQSTWYQKLDIAHGSLSRVSISQPKQDKKHNRLQQQSHHQIYQQLHQQVTTIAMPLLEGF